MRMSTKGRFAVNALIDLALRESAGPVALASIAERQQISLSYLEQLFGRLAAAIRWAVARLRSRSPTSSRRSTSRWRTPTAKATARA